LPDFRKGDISHMHLTKDEEKMLSGGYGEGYRKAMEILVKLYDVDNSVDKTIIILTASEAT
jgi:predicted aconitase